MRETGMSMRVAGWVASFVCLLGCTDAGTADPALDAGADDAVAPVEMPPADLDGYVQWEMGHHGIAGLAAVIVKDDAPAWTGTFGFADIDAAEPVTEDTLFLVASISKTIVTVPVMQLVERGLLDLDAPIDDYLPYPVRHPAYPDVPITARMILTHTSGLEDDFVTLADAMGDGAPPMTLAEFAESYVTPGGALYADGNWGAEPGTAWSYCNAAFGILGRLTEVVGGAPLEELTKTGVRDPLGMPSSGWLSSEVPADGLAVGYTWNGRDYTQVRYQVLSYYPAGGFVTSLAELTRFLRATVRLGELDGERILSIPTAQTMRNPQVPDIRPSQAITWRYLNVAGQQWLGHSGATLGGSADMMFRPTDDAAVIVLTNSDAYVLARLGITETADALDRIVARLAAEADVR